MLKNNIGFNKTGDKVNTKHNLMYRYIIKI